MEEDDNEFFDCQCVIDFYQSRKIHSGHGALALEDWRRNPFIWLYYVQSNDGLQLADDVLRANDRSFWSIKDVQRYFRSQLHCKKVLFTCQYPNLRLPTSLGNHYWRSNTAQKRPSTTYLKEFHRSLSVTLKKMEAEQTQMDRLIIFDQLINVDLMDYHRRKMFFNSLLTILSFQDSLQLVSFENLCSTRLEGVRLIQQLACFDAHSLKYLFLWHFVRHDENPLLVNYSYITGSGEHIPRPGTSRCFLRSLGELKNLRVLALEYGHIADGTGTALVYLLPVLKRPHFRLQLLCGDGHVPGLRDPSLGGGGKGIPDYAWRRVAITCPDLVLSMLFYLVVDYDHIRRFLTASVPLREVQLQQGLRLDCEDFDINSFLGHVIGHYASAITTLSIHLRRCATVPLRSTLERLPTLVSLHCVGAVEQGDLRDVLVLIACGVCYNLKQVRLLLEVDNAERDQRSVVIADLREEFKGIMKLFEIDLSIELY